MTNLSGQTALVMPEALNVLDATLSVISDGSAVPAVIVEEHLPTGFAVPNHVHDNVELFYILEGEITVAGPQGEMKAAAGAVVNLPRGVWHGVRNASAAPARVLVVLSPGLQVLEMYRHFDRAGRTAPLAPDAIASIAAQYGVRLV